jgi:GDPmannose 4,6-dehydratase
MFGKVAETPQTIFHSRSPYGVVKTHGHYIMCDSRESFGVYGVSGILFNHESPRLGAEFVTRKISLAVTQIKLGLREKLQLRKLDAVRDWGFVGDYVRVMHLMLRRDEPSGFVIGTGGMHSVRDAVRIVFESVVLNWHVHVVIDPALVRRAEVEALCAVYGRAEAELGWKPTVEFADLMCMMVESESRAGIPRTRLRRCARGRELATRPPAQPTRRLRVPVLC